MGKVNGVTTGVLAARSQGVVIADDDVRWDREALERAAALLDGDDLSAPELLRSAALARPPRQRPQPPEQGLDRRPGVPRGDFPGTLVVRRASFLATGGYDGDVMFENLELMRTIEAAGGTVRSPLDLYVRRLPPTARHFAAQRVRQAYDDFAIPARMAAFLSVIPAAAVAAAGAGTGRSGSRRRPSR